MNEVTLKSLIVSLLLKSFALKLFPKMFCKPRKVNIKFYFPFYHFR